MTGHRFTAAPAPKKHADFDALLKIFLELLQYTSGDAAEALSWMTEIDRKHGLTGPEYGMGDFIRELKEKGYLRDEPGGPSLQITAKTERGIRQQALEEIFGKLKKSAPGNHKTPFVGIGDEPSGDARPFVFGDSPDDVHITESFINTQIRHGLDGPALAEDSLVVAEREHKATCATVLLIDVSHSMILYGEDRITPAKKVAMALAELITTRYPKDALDVAAFGDEAFPVEIKDLPYLQVGPYHTNTVAGLELAIALLRRRKTTNKQIFMITDGKPTCLKEGAGYYRNSFGLDPKIVNRTLNLAAQCKRLRIPITTFMIARDPYLQRFVRDFTQTNGGRAYYSKLQGLGEFLFEDFVRNRRKTVR
jgi:uncharacterized protein with von Willebrand factor type A (vWA) domain